MTLVTGPVSYAASRTAGGSAGRAGRTGPLWQRRLRRTEFAILIPESLDLLELFEVEFAMVFCPRCGVTAATTDAYCMSCGAPVGVAPSPSQGSGLRTIASRVFPVGPESVLNDDEKPLLRASCKLKTSSDWRDPGSLGTLFMTEDTLVFVTASGALKKRYEKSHYFPLRSIRNVRVESAILGLGKSLVVEWEGSDGNPLTYSYGMHEADAWRSAIISEKQKAEKRRKTREEAFALSRSQERTSFDEIISLYEQSLGVSFSDENIAGILASWISSGKLEGFVDREQRQFVHLTAYKRKTEVVHYNIATSFEFGKDGAILIRCPSCNAPSPQTERARQVKCGHCGHTFAVPTKILDLI